MLRDEMGAVARGVSNRPIIITNSCAEEIRAEQSIMSLGRKTLDEIGVVERSRLLDPIIIQRVCGQFVKPRSSMTEMRNGEEVLSYMGDGINSREGDRMPDASRLVAGALQSRDIQEYITRVRGEAVLTAHEALSLPYELPFVREDAESGRTYLTSAHLPWIGKRTNQAAGVHVDLLSGIDNSIGIKIGADSNQHHIGDLVDRLDPERTPGKLAFMIRIGAQDREKLKPILTAIRMLASRSVVLYDIHGTMRTREDGKKIRMRSEILEDIESLALACADVGLRLNGLHLETMNIHGRFECLNNEDQTPMPGSVDPRLNPKQTRYILDKAAPFINQ
jgi:3-deoxy-7-phosphoheptulonate synthase